MKKRYLFFAVTIMLVALPSLEAQKKESLAVFAFTGGNTSDGEAIASSLTRQAALRNAFNRTTLITRSTMATMNFEQRFQRNSGLTDADTIFELGKALNASHVIAGYIAKLGDRNLVLVSIMDIESLQQIAGDYRSYGSIEEVDTLIPAMAQKLAAAVPRNTTNLPGLSVPPFNIASGVNQSDAMVLAQILSCDLANSGKYAVLPRTDSIDKVMDEHKRQRDGTTDQARIKVLGAGRNAQLVLSGSVQRLGTLNKLAADILDILDGSFKDGYEESYSDLSQGIEVMPKLAARLSGTSVQIAPASTSRPAANNPPASASSPASSSDIISENAGWLCSFDSKSTAKLNIGRETIDGRERDVLTLEVNLAKGTGYWAGANMTNESLLQKLRTASGVRFKVLGDGKNWAFGFDMPNTAEYWHRVTVSTRNGRVVDVDVPFSKLKQPDWGRKITFSKDRIRTMKFEKMDAHGAGSSTIKVFDFEIY